MPEEKGIMYELLNVDADKASEEKLRALVKHYSEASMLPLSTSAAFQISCSKPISAPLTLVNLSPSFPTHHYTVYCLLRYGLALSL